MANIEIIDPENMSLPVVLILARRDVAVEPLGGIVCKFFESPVVKVTIRLLHDLLHVYVAAVPAVDQLFILLHRSKGLHFFLILRHKFK